MLMVGIDIGKTELFVCLDGDEQKAAKPCANTAAGHQNLLTWLNKRGAVPQETQVVMESTSVYWEVLAFTLHDAGFKVSVVNPAKIKFFARSLLRRGKTDTLDATLIAQYGATMRSAGWTPPEIPARPVGRPLFPPCAPAGSAGPIRPVCGRGGGPDSRPCPPTRLYRWENAA